MPLILTAICLLALMFWEFLDYRVIGPPIAHIQQSIRPEEGRPGDVVMTTWRYELRRPCPRDVTLFIADIPVSTYRDPVPVDVDTPRTIYRELTIPRVPPGRYTVRTISEFYCNPIKPYLDSVEIPITVVATQ